MYKAISLIHDGCFLHKSSKKIFIYIEKRSMKIKNLDIVYVFSEEQIFHSLPKKLWHGTEIDLSLISEILYCLFCQMVHSGIAYW